MNTDDFLNRLQAQLKGFSPDEQSRLIEEIAAHIETGENDPALGRDAPARAARLENELGSPVDLGRRLRQVHRPNRWLDFLVVLLPNILVFPFLLLLASWILGLSDHNVLQNTDIVSMSWVSARLGIIAQLALVLASRWKCSAGVSIYWLSSLIMAALALFLSGIHWPWLPADFTISKPIGTVEAVFWLAALSLLLVWFVRLVIAHRSEPLLVVLAALPFLSAAANYAAGLMTLHYPIEQFNSSHLAANWLSIYQVMRLIWIALFFLPDQRDLRWAGLMLIPLASITFYLWPYRVYPLVAILASLPLILVLAAWIRDVRTRVFPAIPLS